MLRTKSLRIVSLASLITLFTACNSSATPAAPMEATPIHLTVSAAASMTDSLKQLQPLFEKEHPAIKLTFNFGSSGALQKQIEQGAPVDLFISAGAKQMKDLVDQQLVEPSKQTNLLSNQLVVIVPSDSKLPKPQKLEELGKPDYAKLSIADPETVPAGSYAKESMTQLGLWTALQPKLVPAKDVRQVLTYVETGNVDAGIVYQTDALTSKKVQQAFAVDPKSHKPIEYPVGIIRSTKHSKETADLYEFLQGKTATELFVTYGFTVPSGKK
jgi:molybdate transport system substrate-binding protein